MSQDKNRRPGMLLGRDPGSNLVENLGPGHRHAGATVYACAAVLIALHVFLGARAITALSPTYDEPVHLTAGVAALKAGNFNYNGYHHPIFAEAWAALPSVFLKPLLPVHHPAWTKQEWRPFDQYRFADVFLYKNRVNHEKLLNSGRWMVLLLSVIFMVAAGILVLNTYGSIAALWFGASWAFSPTMLAHATLVSTDLAFAGFFFLFFLVYQTMSRTPTQPPPERGRSIVLGLLLGLCLASKYLGLALLPIAGLLWIIEKRSVRDGLIVLGVALIVPLLFYRGDIGVFIDGLTQIVTRSQAGRSSFFLGEHSVSGSLAYFPFAFFAKSTPFELAGLLLMIPFFLKRQVPRALWIPPLLFFVLACFSKVQIGHRHILAVYPFVFLLGGVALQNMAPRFHLFAPVAAGLMLVQAIVLAPNYLSYFNMFVGGPGKGYAYMTDSNNDWGQGLKQLRDALEPDDLKDGIYLCYFGTADPHAYGLRYINIASDSISGHVDNSGDLSVHPTKFAISITNYQHTYYQSKSAFSWLREHKPWKLVGNSILVFDFKDSPNGLMSLQEMRGAM